MAKIPDSPDRRRAPRLGPISVQALLESEKGERARVEIFDVSTTGVFAHHPNPDLPFRTRITLKLDGGLVLSGEIVHIVDAAGGVAMNHPTGYGVQLFAPPADVVTRVTSLEGGAPRPSLAPRSAPARPPRRRPIALIIEDDARVGRAACRAMGTMGYRSIHESNAKTGMDRADEMQGELTIAIVDGLLPDSSGAAIIAHLRATQPDLPILAISGVMRSHSARKVLLDAGADAFLAKPFLSADFCRAAARLAIRGRPVVKDAA